MADTKPTLVEYTQLPVQVPSLSAWSVERVKCALAEQEQGVFTQSSLLFEALERGPRIVNALNTRILTLLGLPFDLLSGDGDGRRDGPAVKKIKPYWSSIASHGAVGRLKRWELGLGVAFGELVWRYDAGAWVPRIKPWHPSFFRWDWTTQSYWVNTLEGFFPITPGDGHWLVFSGDECLDRPWMRGLVRCLALEESIRNYAVRDWARYSEIHGIPIRLLRIPMNADPRQKGQFVSSVVGMGGEANVFAYRGKSEEESFGLDLVEAKDNSWEGFQKLLGAIDTDLEIAIIGRAVTNATGVYNPKDMSQGVRQDLTEADAQGVSSFLYSQVSQPWALYNLGPQSVASAPRPVYDATPRTDRKIEAETLAQLALGMGNVNAELRKVGKEISAEDYLARFNIPLRENTAEPEPEPDPNAPEVTYGEPEDRPDVKTTNKAATKKLSATGTHPIVEGQAYVDDVTDAALKLAPAAMDPVLSACLSELDASTDYADLRARLIALVGHTDPSGVRALLGPLVALAEATGIWTVEQERR